MKIALMLPLTFCSAERAFSKLNLIKSRLRSMMNDEPRKTGKSDAYVSRTGHNRRARHRNASSRFCGHMSEKNEFSMTMQ